ncbi:hypothetical protein [Aliiruegeria haliotis]|nr:hypothetical protein [Aliiruegeria haliotis]
MRLIVLSLTLVSMAATVEASNIVDSARKDMARAGYPDSCVAKLTNNDAAKITSWRHDPDLSSGNANRRTKDQYERICKR